MPRRFILTEILALVLLLGGCLGVSGETTPQGQDKSAVVLAVPLDHPFSFTVPSETLVRAGNILRGLVVSVHDGYTITVLIDGRKEKVRLIGIDAPELDQASWGVQARDVLRGLVDSKSVRLETDVTVRDQYKRLLAYVYVGDTFVNLEMVRQGQAVVYTVPPNVVHVEEYRKAELEAREAGRGVWDTAQPLDVAPDCYGKMKEGREC